MGITGLLPIVKKALTRRHIGKYSNARIGIDGHSWIHRVIPYIATDLYYNKPTQKHLDLLMSKIKSLLDYNIIPVFIFDGDFLYSKEKTNEQRRQQKERYKKEVEMALKRNNLERARELMKRCVSVTPEILHSVLNFLRKHNIEYIVSPYEADAQLYFLQKQGFIDYIITEDSDLIVYGATKILYKFDGTHTEEYDFSKLHLCRDKFFQENIMDICILSGCDYLDSIKGVGLITAHEKLRELGSVRAFVDHMIAIKKVVPKNYIEEFNKAKATFLHHIVFNPYKLERQFLSEPSMIYEFLGTLENLPFRIHDFLFNRYFIPKTLKGSVTEEEKENISAEDISFVLDSNLALPYFQE